MPTPYTVDFAIYGALPDSKANEAAAYDVTARVLEDLNSLDEASGGILQIGGPIFIGADPAPGNTKHFGALVNNRYFACQEGQTINFNSGGGPSSGSSGPATGELAVKFAVYGALPDSDSSNAQAYDVTALLQAFLNVHQDGNVVCGNGLFGDPCYGFQKHFAAVVTRFGVDFSFACEEGQTIDFMSGGGTQEVE
jgi:hypothetical protein